MLIINNYYKNKCACKYLYWLNDKNLKRALIDKTY